MNIELTYWEKIALTKWGNYIKKEVVKSSGHKYDQIKNRNQDSL